MSLTAVLVVVLFGMVMMPRGTEATIGLDISEAACESMASSDWSCLHKEGFSFAIIQAWDGGYKLNSKLATCINDALKAGFSHVDVYVFMCPNCNGNSPTGTIQSVVDALKGVKYGELWFDIEQCSGCWSTNLGSNCNWIGQAVKEAESLKVNIGFYSNHYEWGVTVGSGCTSFSKYPIWYADYDDQQNFNDWEAFGGWTKPEMKQYEGGIIKCNLNIDLDWYPSSIEGSLSNSTLVMEK